MIDLILTWLAGFSGVILSSAGGNNFPPPLEREEEDRYFRLLKKNGDMKAREKLIEHNLRLVAHVVRKYYASSPLEEDLISIGTIGLIKSVDSFDIDNGARFATYAARCIQNAILSQRIFCTDAQIKEKNKTAYRCYIWSCNAARRYCCSAFYYFGQRCFTVSTIESSSSRF